MELYALLARSLIQGKTSLPIEPRPELLSLRNPYDPKANLPYRLHDASLYKDRYYLYFGIVPAVTLFVPYRFVTRLDLPNRAAVPVFCIAGYLTSYALFFLLAKHNRWLLPSWLQCAIVLSLGTMSLVCLILRTPAFYQVPIAAGYFFVMAGFLTLARGIFVVHAAKRFLLAGLMFGMAVGCRPHFAVICGIVLVGFAVRARRSPELVIAMAAGMAVCAVGLGWYNYVRFDDPLEFGRTYQLTQFSSRPGSTYYGLELNGRAGLRSAEKFLFQAPHVNTTSPFFHTVWIDPLLGRAGRPLWMEDMVGLIPAAPLALLGFFMPLFLGRRRIANASLDGASLWLLKAMYWCGVAVFFILCIVGWVIGRYLVDFAPLLIFVSVSLVAMLWQKIPPRPIRLVFSLGVGAATIYGAAVDTALATPRLDIILRFLRTGT
ncbi:MAG TPA: hypothetical protein VL240_03610 [Candidatus Binatia bacterium]|nr:hypothetical protein [Candidatus Binatia bacterium]